MPCPMIACCIQGWGCFYVCDLAFTAADRCRLSIFHLLWCCGYFCILKLTFAFVFISLWKSLPFRQQTIICVLGSLKIHEANKAAGLVHLLSDAGYCYTTGSFSQKASVMPQCWSNFQVMHPGCGFLMGCDWRMAICCCLSHLWCAAVSISEGT